MVQNWKLLRNNKPICVRMINEPIPFEKTLLVNQYVLDKKPATATPFKKCRLLRNITIALNMTSNVEMLQVWSVIVGISIGVGFKLVCSRDSLLEMLLSSGVLTLSTYLNLVSFIHLSYVWPTNPFIVYTHFFFILNMIY